MINHRSATTAPHTAIDLYCDDVLRDPYPVYRRIRDAGPVVWMPAYSVFALSRYAQVRSALGDWELFSSAQGVALNEVMNSVDGVLNLDPPEHAAERRLLMGPVTQRALKKVTDQITDEAERMADELVQRRTFDGVTDLAQRIPMMIISRLIGLPERGRARLLQWGADGFNVQGPMNDRTARALPGLAEMQEYLATEVRPDNVPPDSWASYIFEETARQNLSVERAWVSLLAYVIPSLDTTIQAMANAVWLFAEHPDQWDLVRQRPSLVNRAINEVLRVESPVQTFSRVLTRDHEIGGVALPAGARVLVMFGSANRDERKWPDPERFDVTRPEAAEHLAFGFGEHLCLGQYLARLELRAQLTALARRVERFRVGEATRSVNNVLRGFTSLEVSVT